LIYAFESGALNESFADIMAVVCDQENGALDWTQGENRTGMAGPVRDLSNPNASPNPQPAVYSGYSPGTPVIVGNVSIYPDHGGVHFNSGIPNKTAYLMAVGQQFNGVTVNGMGRNKMRDLKFASLQLLPPIADFAAARVLEVALATAWAESGLNGFSADDVCTVRNAWAAVEIGHGDYDCDGNEDAAVSDFDKDYILDNMDNCPYTANPGQEDIDSDGVGDPCDNCKSNSNPDQLDTDHDGRGNVCDDDDDNDGCKDTTDFNPLTTMARIGHFFGPCCSGDSLGYEGQHSDNDELLNCEDEDDDNDGIPDEADSCPIGDYLGLAGCTLIDGHCTCDRWDWWTVCLLGGCNELLLKFVSVSYPDFTEIVFDQFSIVNQRLFVFPNIGNSAAQSAAKITSGGISGVAQAMAGAPSLLRLEIWTRGGSNGPGHFLGLVGEFDPAEVELDQTLEGSFLVIASPTAQTLNLASAWTVGVDPDNAMADLDLDGMPDGWENYHGLGMRTPGDASIDADSDGLSNRDEFRSGTDPMDADSSLHLKASRAAGALRLSFDSVFGKQYRIERADTLGAPSWSAAGPPLTGTGEIMDLLATAPAGQRQSFYRIALVLP
jgi:hypothetical protein